MNHNQSAESGRVQRNPETGLWICRRCSGDIPAGEGRRAYCLSLECRDWAVRNRIEYARAEVRNRDKGICCHCGIDTAKFHPAFYSWLYSTPQANFDNQHEWLLFHGLGPRLRAQMWDCDHIIPVAEGGGGGLDNLQTLCIQCHRNKTSSQLRRGKRCPN